MHSSVDMSIPVSQSIPLTLMSPLGIHTFFSPSVYVFISALQINLSIPFSWIPHTCISTRFVVLTYFTLYESLGLIVFNDFPKSLYFLNSYIFLKMALEINSSDIYSSFFLENVIDTKMNSSSINVSVLMFSFTVN